MNQVEQWFIPQRKRLTAPNFVDLDALGERVLLDRQVVRQGARESRRRASEGCVGARAHYVLKLLDEILGTGPLAEWIQQLDDGRAEREPALGDVIALTGRGTKAREISERPRSRAAAARANS